MESDHGGGGGVGGGMGGVFSRQVRGWGYAGQVGIGQTLPGTGRVYQADLLFSIF